MRQKLPRLHLQTGVGLIEVMVAMILMAMGLLGAVALQVATTKEQRSSQFVSRAALAANEISERMRTNRQGIEYNLYDTGASTYSDVQTILAAGTTPPMAACSYTAPVCPGPTPTQAECTADALAACTAALAVQTNDMNDWFASLRASLPSASAHILATPSGINSLSRDIVIAWVEPVVDKDASGNPIKITTALSGCPAALATPDGVRCYRFRFML